MASLKDLSGLRFGRILISKRSQVKKYGQVFWDGKCDCGKEGAWPGQSLTSGNTTSCGCLHRELLSKRASTHGMTRGLTRGKNKRCTEYETWAAMRQRCENPNNSHYKYYGAKGISVCARWKSFTNFISDMGPKPSPELSIHRLKNELGYEPSNCIWADNEIQYSHRTDNRLFEFRGETKTMSQWSRAFEISVQTVWTRLSRGCTIEEALTRPLRNANRSKETRLRPGL